MTRPTLRRLLVPSALILSCAGMALADEGMWLFNNPPLEKLAKDHGFKATPEWLEHVQKSAVRFSTGGSGSIVSADGLVMTNHHVGSEVLYELSTPDKDLLQEGFWARNRADEPKCPSLELVCLWEIVDVTERVKSAAAPGATAADAEAARRKIMSTIEKESLDATGLKSDVVTLYQGGRYHLYRYKRFDDVRLVFAPEKQAAFFGGDPDNFEFPRYDLDCCFFRIYVDGKPYRPEHYLAWSAKGASEDELVFVAGHPGRTERLYTVDHLEYMRDLRYPMTLARLWRREVQLRNFSDRSAEWRRIAEDEYFGVQNSRKAYTGLLAGLLDPAVLEAKRVAEATLKAFVESDPKRKADWGGAWDQIATAQQVSRAIYRRNAAVNTFGSDLFTVARHLVRLSAELPRPNADRLREYGEAGLESLKQQLFSPAPIHADLEIDRLASGLSLMAEWLGVEDPLVSALLAGRSPRARAEELVHGSTLADVAVRKALYEGGAKAIAASKDPLILLAAQIDPEARALRKRVEDEVDGPQKAGYAKIAAAKFAMEGESLYPDATFTLRLSYGTVKAYEENGARVEPFTTIEGLYGRSAERKDQPPFDLPAKWVENKDEIDLATPYNFVSTCDIIGGNSGSPTINALGEVVGLIFDGNIQSLTGDVLYTEEQARAVSVDSRAMIEAIRKVYMAEPLAQELLGAKP